MRQIVELISQRKNETARFTARITEWQTKYIAIALSAVAQDPSQTKALQKIVKSMKLPLADEESIDTRSIEEVIEQGAIVDLANQPSYEELAAAFGA